MKDENLRYFNYIQFTYRYAFLKITEGRYGL